MNGRRARERRRNVTAGPVLFLLSEIADDLDEKTKNALAVRNACSFNGICPTCGVGPTGPYLGDDGLIHITFEHEEWCDCLRDDEAA